MALLRMDVDESKTEQLRIILNLAGPDGQDVPCPPTENPNPDPDPETICRSLRRHVPEVTTRIIRILGVARDPGKRSVIAVGSNHPEVDPVGICTGERGSRARAIIGELGGEKICIVRWEKPTERFIASVLGPLRVISVALDQATREAKVRAEKGSNWPSTWSGLHPDFELRTKLLMDLTGWKLRLDVQDEN